MNYEKWYNRWASFANQHLLLVSFLRITNKLITLVMYLSYPVTLWYVYSYCDVNQLVKMIGIPAVGFILVSIFRRYYNQARPYETWNIVPLFHKDSRGQSFPSRHVFSATIVSFCILSVSAGLGYVYLMLAILLGVLRVLGGVHYPKDVCFGFLVGVLFGLVMMLL